MRKPPSRQRACSSRSRHVHADETLGTGPAPDGTTPSTARWRGTSGAGSALAPQQPPLPAGGILSQPVKADYNAFLYAYEGNVTVGPAATARLLDAHRAGVLAEGDRIEAKAGAAGARLLVLAGRPLREPVVQYGPFVMNTREEIEQAIRDYQAGELTRPAA